MKGYIYLIQVREFNKLNENTYKVGRTEDFNRQFSEYPKDSILLYSCIVNNALKLENLILPQFKISFIYKPCYGHEYFQGDYTNMLIISLLII